MHHCIGFTARIGRGASHGCADVRDRRTMSWLFDRVGVGACVAVAD